MSVRIFAPLPDDFRVEDHGSLILLKALTVAAEGWVDEHLPSEAQRWAGAVVIEPRFIGDIVLGIQQSGLRVTL
jgi:hypothetical protein